MNRIIGAYHIALMNNWREIVSEQLKRMSGSGLLGVTDKVIVGVVGGEIRREELGQELAKKATIVCSPNLTDYEFWTLRILQRNAISKSFKAWYVHTKGVSKKQTNPVLNWRRLMEYFIIDRFNVCLRELDSCDACGVNVITDYPHVRFFAGNFWWANSKHLSRLPKIDSLDLSDRFCAEHWIGTGAARMKDLYTGNRNSYCLDSLRESHPVYRLKSGAVWKGDHLSIGRST